MPPNPNSHDDSNGSSALLGALTGTDPQAGAAIRADNDRAATDPASPLSVAPRVQRQEPSTQIDSGPRAKVSDFPAADTNAPGLVPAAPDPARALHGYDPSDGTQFDVQLPAQAPNIGMLNDPHPAGKARLDDGPDGQPRYAVLNSAGQYLFTVDRDGNKISSGTEKTDSGHSGSLVEAGTGTALTGGAAKGLQAGEEGLQAGEEAGLAAALLAAAETGGEEGALVGAAADGVGAIPGAAIGAAINVLAVVATTELYNHSQRPRKTDSTPDSSDRVDPGLLPDITPSTSGHSSGTTTPKPGAGVRSYAEPQAPAPGARPGAADDPDTSHQRVSFPSAKPGQTNVPVLGTYWCRASDFVAGPVVCGFDQ